jgi:hypothetical protein
VEEYFQNAAVPALNRLGSKHIGVFTEYLPQGHTKLFVLIPYNSLEDFLKIPDKMAIDASYKQAAATYLNAQATEPAYERIESSLFRAFAQMPKMESPKINNACLNCAVTKATMKPQEKRKSKCLMKEERLLYLNG